MHTLTLSAPVILGPDHRIEVGRYAVEDLSGAQMMSLAGGGRMMPLALSDGRQKLDPAVDYNGKRILVMRVGGFGDLLLLTPVLREIRRRWPTASISVSTMAHYAQVLEGLPYVDAVLPYPLPHDAIGLHDVAIFYERAIEGNPRAEQIHATEVFAEIAGLPVDGAWSSLKPEYRVRPSEALWAQASYPRVNGTKRIGIQVGASAIARVYPQHLMGELAVMLLKRGFEVYLLGSGGEVRLPEKSPDGLRNIAADNLTFRQSCAVVSQCDCLIGPDSALVHVAGALDVPAVGLYGPFRGDLRVSHSPSVTVVQGGAECEPCFHHVNPTRKNHFPDHCPSKAKGHCRVLASITPTRIAMLVDRVAREPGKMDGAVMSVRE